MGTVSFSVLFFVICAGHTPAYEKSASPNRDTQNAPACPPALGAKLTDLEVNMAPFWIWVQFRKETTPMIELKGREPQDGKPSLYDYVTYAAGTLFLLFMGLLYYVANFGG